LHCRGALTADHELCGCARAREAREITRSPAHEALDGCPNLGSGFFKDFKVVFDLPHDRLILERPAAQ
jgi:hypothetical protein